MSESDGARIHQTAIIEDDVVVGPGTVVWDHVHIRRAASLGRNCIVGGKTYVAYEVVIGDFVKINSAVYICTGVTIEDFCMVGAHAVFTNDRFPRAGDRDLTGLETSGPTSTTLSTRVCRGATIGANATIGPGVTLGEFSMIGMGAVVTRDVPAHALVIGSPARQSGWVCVCGRPLSKATMMDAAAGEDTTVVKVCSDCDRAYSLDSVSCSLQAPDTGTSP